MKALNYLLALLAFPICGYAFSVNPMVAEFDPTNTKAHQNYVLSNTSDKDKPIEVLVARPVINENGNEEMKTGEGEDQFVILPQQLLLPANSKRTVKVYYVGDAQDKEETYRIIFKELPVDIQLDDTPLGPNETRMNMHIVMQYNTRVWVTPRSLESNVQITGFEKIDEPAPQSQSADDGPSDNATIPMLKLTVANTGDRHQYFKHSKVFAITKDGRSIELSRDSIKAFTGQLIHSNETRDFKLSWHEDFPDVNEINELQIRQRRRR